jgi:hypothetical protein
MVINLDIDVWNNRTCISANGHKTALGASPTSTYGLLLTTPLHTAFKFKSRGTGFLSYTADCWSSHTNIHTQVSMTKYSTGR